MRPYLQRYKIQPMKIVFTKHATKDKFPMLTKHKPHLKEQDIINVLENPEHEDKQSDKPNIIASGSLDEKHVLRVVYRREGDISNLSKIGYTSIED